MYKVFLNYAQVKEYLSVVLDNGLLEEIEEGKTYRTSEKGRAFLRLYEQTIKNALSSKPA